MVRGRQERRDGLWLSFWGQGLKWVVLLSVSRSLQARGQRTPAPLSQAHMDSPICFLPKGARIQLPQCPYSPNLQKVICDLQGLTAIGDVTCCQAERGLGETRRDVMRSCVLGDEVTRYRLLEQQPVETPGNPMARREDSLVRTGFWSKFCHCHV